VVVEVDMVTSLGWILRAPRDLHASLDLEMMGRHFFSASVQHG
jgi:hypothetical protein